MRVAFALRDDSILVCELFPHHMPGSPEGKEFGRLKREGFAPDDYEGFKPLVSTS